LKLFHLFFKAFVIIALTVWTLVNTFQMFYFLFKSRFFIQKFSKFVDPLSFDVVFRFDLHHIQMDATLFSYYHRVLIQFLGLICTTYKWMQPTSLLPWGAYTIFRFDLHHIQMDATQLFCCPWKCRWLILGISSLLSKISITKCL
jgi:hypothetical protein